MGITIKDAYEKSIILTDKELEEFGEDYLSKPSIFYDAPFWYYCVLRKQNDQRIL